MTGYDILLGPLATVVDRKAFAQQSKDAIERVFDLVLSEGHKLTWVRTPEGLKGSDHATARALVMNANNDPVSIEVHLSSSVSEFGWSRYVVLGEDGPCRNDADPRVDAMFDRVFGKR